MTTKEMIKIIFSKLQKNDRYFNYVEKRAGL